MATAIFAGGCFWCMEPPFEQLDGVESVISGYTGGDEVRPTYQQVSGGLTEHLEAIEVTYDPDEVSYEELLEVFWRQIDPTDPEGQFADRGDQYGTAIFYQSEEERLAAEASRDRLQASGRFEGMIVTEIRAAGPFYPAEEYHQDYHRKNPAHYKRYRVGSGRELFLKRTWGERDAPAAKRYSRPPLPELREQLTPLQYQVTQLEGTEPPFRNEYWDEKRDGIYVDVVSGEPLFASVHKFDSGSGWPSFTRPLEPGHLVEHTDASAGMIRTEVRSRHGDSHLGHLFDDGPAPTGQRYCINSAALRFVPADELERQGYGEYRKLFE